MASEVGIVNIALQRIKNTKRISDLGEGTKEANAADDIYDEMRDLLLDLHTWNFATKRVKLGRLSSTPAFGWDYEYELPADFIRVVSAHNNSDERDRLIYRNIGGRVPLLLFAVFLMLGGIQLISTGLIGEMLTSSLNYLREPVYEIEKALRAGDIEQDISPGNRTG